MRVLSSQFRKMVSWFKVYRLKETHLEMKPPLSHFCRASVFSGKSSSGRCSTSTNTESSAWTSGRRRSSRADTMSWQTHIRAQTKTTIQLFWSPATKAVHSGNIICLTTGCIRDTRQAPNGITDTDECINVAHNLILETKTSQSICMAHIILHRDGKWLISYTRPWTTVIRVFFIINKLSIDVWFVRRVQYFVEIQLFENLEFGCK